MCGTSVANQKISFTEPSTMDAIRRYLARLSLNYPAKRPTKSDSLFEYISCLSFKTFLGLKGLTATDPQPFRLSTLDLPPRGNAFAQSLCPFAVRRAQSSSLTSSDHTTCKLDDKRIVFTYQSIAWCLQSILQYFTPNM